MPLTVGEAKGCCHVAYDGVSNERYRFPAGDIWSVVDHWATSITGFKAVLLRSDRHLVLSFAGTDSIMDALVDLAQVGGSVPPQYPQALALTMAARSVARGRVLQLAGHSLGGGLAAYCSVSTGLTATTVNPAPLIGAATLGSLAEYAQVTNYIAQGGEVVSSSPGRNPGTDIYVPSTGGTFGFFTDHMLANVAPAVPLPVKL
jgi:hypothetical protein